MYMRIAWKGRFRNDLYCVGRDVKPYSLTHCAVFGLLIGYGNWFEITHSFDSLIHL